MKLRRFEFPDRLLAWLVLSLGTVFVVTVAATLLLRGPFAWHVSQPEAWQGGIEAATLGLAVFVALQWRQMNPAVRLLLFLIPTALYLRRHHVDAVLPIILLYVEGLIALGAALRRLCGSEDLDDWLRNLIAGIALMSLLLWLSQLAGFGLPRTQRLLAGLVLVPALILGHRRLLSVRLARAAIALDSAGMRAWAAVLIALPLVLLARTNTVADFDSLWYGLRPERVLVGDASVFESLGFASPVHYFPKLYEVLLLPLSAMREDSAVQGVSVLLGGLLALLVFQLLRRLHLPTIAALAGSAAIWTIPALAAASLGAKADVLTALLVVAMAWFGWNIAEGRRSDLAWVFACAGLAVSAKLLAIPYVGAAGIAALVAAWLVPGESSRMRGLDGPLVLLVVIGVGSLVCARTWWLTGMPTIGPEQLVRIWITLGMELHAPVGTLSWVLPQRWSELPSLFVGWILDPSRFSHLQISWPSNLWLYLPVLALIAARRDAPLPRASAVLWAVPITGIALLTCVGFMNRGGDGNYFIAPAVLASIAGLGLAWRSCRTSAARFALLCVLGLYTGFHFAYGFVSANWSVGTRPWDLDLLRTNRDSPIRNQQILVHHHLDGVAHWLHGQGGRTRVVGVTPDAVGNRLPARYEEFSDVVLSHLTTASLQEMQGLLACGHTSALLVPNPMPEPIPHAAAQSLVEWALALPAPELYRDEHWRLIDVGRHLPDCRLSADALAPARTQPR